MTHDDRFSAVILAAGLSQRMGRPKLSLLLSDGRSFAEACLEAFVRFGCHSVVLVVNPGGAAWIQEAGIVERLPSQAISVVVNESPERGRMHSLQLGLSAVGTADPVFVHNVDSPYVSAGVLQLLAGALAAEGGASWVSPRYGGRGGHPVLLSAAVAAKVMEVAGGGGDLTLNSVLQAYRRIDVAVSDSGVLANINSLKR